MATDLDGSYATQHFTFYLFMQTTACSALHGQRAKILYRALYRLHYSAQDYLIVNVYTYKRIG